MAKQFAEQAANQEEKILGEPTVFAISMQKIDPSVGNSMIKMLKQMKKDAIDEVFAEFKT